MHDLVVDLTPTCVNKTAIRHVALDTTNALASHFRLSRQYRGERAELLADCGQEDVVATVFHEDLDRWGSGVWGTPIAGPPDDDRTPRLYFDPIYTLYRSLSPNDVVFVLDLSPLTDPEWHAATVGRCYVEAFDHVIRSPAKVVCISTHCATALRAGFSVASAEITTVPLYLRNFHSEPKHGARSPYPALEGGPFFLFVGSLERRKNLVGLMRAFAMSGLIDEGWCLICVGGNGHGADAIREAASEFAGIELLGFISDDELDWLYRNAAAFVYPSYLEGFGLPLLEAMSYGLPCLASTTGASSEICGDLALLVDPYDVPAIADGLRSCALSARHAPREQIKERARHFTFERYFEALLPVIEQAAA